MKIYSLLEGPDRKGMEDDAELVSAMEWLRQDPSHRAVQAPTELSAILDYYRAERDFPTELHRENFLSPSQPFPDGTETRTVGYRGYTL